MENITAKVSCFARAYHFKNNTTHIFADDVAELLLGAEYDQIAQSMTQGMDFFLPGFEGSAEEGLRLIVDGQLSPTVLGRSAYCEHMLHHEMLLGCTQYVVIAAGYDTFALRNRNLALKVFELDLPEVLSDKAMRERRAVLSSPALPVPCNLGDPSWVETLLRQGFDPAEKSFASLLGISYYLTGPEWERLMDGASTIMSEGSALCFDYPCAEGSEGVRKARSLAAGAGERMRSLYTYAEMESLLERTGFLIYEHLDHRAMTECYFSAYNASTPAHHMVAQEGVGYVLAVRR